jgi:hypothetical protein
MGIILKDFLWAYTLLGRNIVIISDMARKEKDAMNFTAGADSATSIQWKTSPFFYSKPRNNKNIAAFNSLNNPVTIGMIQKADW